jgi:hypothetical protein
MELQRFGRGLQAGLEPGAIVEFIADAGGAFEQALVLRLFSPG